MKAIKTYEKRRRIGEETYILSNDTIELNYGIEIECVFDIINYLTVYIYFVKFFSNTKEFKTDNISSKDFNNVFEELFKILDNENLTEELNNDIFEELKKIHESDNKFFEYFKNKYDDIEEQAIILDTEEYNKEYEEFKLFLKNITELITEIVKIFKSYLEKTEISSIEPKILSLLENIILGNEISNIENNIKFLDLNENKLMIYSINDNLEDFYSKSEEDKLYLYSILDSSVNCSNKKVYKSIISNTETLEKYKFLLNSREFITQVFKTPEEIEKKLKYFFENTTVKETILNCYKTSNHVHISFNNDDKIIRPDIQIIIALIYICYYYQDNIFTLFLKSRHNNTYCMKLNYTFDCNMEPHKDDSYYKNLREEKSKKMYKYYDIDIQKGRNYNYIIDILFNIFYKNDNDTKINRYFWLNIVNLYNTTYDDSIGIKPPTVEFRIKHGSTDTEEMANFCKLYANIIKYAIELSKTITIGKNNIILILNELKKNLDSDKNNIYNTKILGNTFDYFKEGSSYRNGLEKLNNLLKVENLSEEEELYENSLEELMDGDLFLKGGIVNPQLLDNFNQKKSIQQFFKSLPLQKKNLDISKSIEKNIFIPETYKPKKKIPETYRLKKITNDFIIDIYEELKSTEIYKINSFGKQYIGLGLNRNMIKGLLLYLDTNDKNSKYSDQYKFDKYLKNNGLYIKNKKISTTI